MILDKQTLVLRRTLRQLRFDIELLQIWPTKEKVRLLHLIDEVLKHDADRNPSLGHR